MVDGTAGGPEAGAGTGAAPGQYTQVDWGTQMQLPQFTKLAGHSADVAWPRRAGRKAFGSAAAATASANAIRVFAIAKRDRDWSSTR